MLCSPIHLTLVIDHYIMLYALFCVLAYIFIPVISSVNRLLVLYETQSVPVELF